MILVFHVLYTKQYNKYPEINDTPSRREYVKEAKDNLIEMLMKLKNKK